ncbi:hypothetical protein MKX03_012790 [Papaver bracteatum]|nr:hypothetical protein MKX03_012790 [Papaver bracteatum]
MASLKMFLQTYWYFFTILFFVHHCSCFNPKLSDASSLAAVSAGATWYGGPFSDGSEGGACGYEKDVGRPPFASMISAGGPSLFKNGNGCGKPVRVVITDSCRGCAQESVHFDLSGPAFGAMAIRGQEDKLRNAGHVPVQISTVFLFFYTCVHAHALLVTPNVSRLRVKCNYGSNIVFRVDAGSNPGYFATLVEYENTDRDIVSIDLQEISSNWHPMQRLMSAKWKVNSPTPLRGPFSLRLKAANGKTIVAQNVIPARWKAGATYRSNVNF